MNNPMLREEDIMWDSPSVAEPSELASFSSRSGLKEEDIIWEPTSQQQATAQPEQQQATMQQMFDPKTQAQQMFLDYAIEPMAEIARSYYQGAGRLMQKGHAIADFSSQVAALADEDSILSQGLKKIGDYFYDLKEEARIQEEGIPSTDMHPAAKFALATVSQAPQIYAEYMLAGKALNAIPASHAAKAARLGKDAPRIFQSLSLVERSALLGALDAYDRDNPAESAVSGAVTSAIISGAVAATPYVLGATGSLLKEGTKKVAHAYTRFVTGLDAKKAAHILEKAQQGDKLYDFSIFKNKAPAASEVNEVLAKQEQAILSEKNSLLRALTEKTKEKMFFISQKYDGAVERLKQKSVAMLEKRQAKWDAKLETKTQEATALAQETLDALSEKASTVGQNALNKIETIQQANSALVHNAYNKAYTGPGSELAVPKNVAHALHSQLGKLFKRYGTFGFGQDKLQYTGYEESTYKGVVDQINRNLGLLKEHLKGGSLNLANIKVLHDNFDMIAQTMAKSGAATGRQMGDFARKAADLLDPKYFARPGSGMSKAAINYGVQKKVIDGVRGVFFQEREGITSLNLDKIARAIKQGNTTEIAGFKSLSDAFDNLLGKKAQVKLFDNCVRIINERKIAEGLVKKTEAAIKNQMQSNLNALKLANAQSLQRLQKGNKVFGFAEKQQLGRQIYEEGEKIKTDIKSQLEQLAKTKEELQAAQMARSFYARMNVSGGTPAGAGQRIAGYGGIGAIAAGRGGLGVLGIASAGLLSPRVATNISLKILKQSAAVDDAIAKVIAPTLSRKGAQELLAGLLRR